MLSENVFPFYSLSFFGVAALPLFFCACHLAGDIVCKNNYALFSIQQRYAYVLAQKKWYNKQEAKENEIQQRKTEEYIDHNIDKYKYPLINILLLFSRICLLSNVHF